MKIIFLLLKNKKTKVLGIGDGTDTVLMMSALFKATLEKISKEKNITMEEAKSILIEILKECNVK